jgi:ssRNA-specific RNase YbeY (16S rRNA maturation enzyme)
LIGYDHELGAREQARMERREVSVLRRFGIRNPYLSVE